MKTSFFLIMLTGVAACSNQTESKPNESVNNIDSNAMSMVSKDTTLGNQNDGIDSDTIPKNIQVDTVIHLAFAKNSSHLEAKGTLNKQSQPVICYLPFNRKVKLIAKLVPEDKNLNIRFSQILTPDGEAEGPFGRQLKYDLVQNGVYKFIIGPNLMANGLRNGDFWIKIDLKEIK